jgi:hypothetical protein
MCAGGEALGQYKVNLIWQHFLLSYFLLAHMGICGIPAQQGYVTDVA